MKKILKPDTKRKKDSTLEGESSTGEIGNRSKNVSDNYVFPDGTKETMSSRETSQKKKENHIPEKAKPLGRGRKNENKWVKSRTTELKYKHT